MGNSYYGRSSEDPLLIGRRADGLNFRVIRLVQHAHSLDRVRCNGDTTVKKTALLIYPAT